MSVAFRIEVERETDGRWIGEGVELPDALDGFCSNLGLHPVQVVRGAFDAPGGTGGFDGSICCSQRAAQREPPNGCRECSGVP